MLCEVKNNFRLAGKVSGNDNDNGTAEVARMLRRKDLGTSQVQELRRCNVQTEKMLEEDVHRVTEVFLGERSGAEAGIQRVTMPPRDPTAEVCSAPRRTSVTRIDGEGKIGIIRTTSQARLAGMKRTSSQAKATLRGEVDANLAAIAQARNVPITRNLTFMTVTQARERLKSGTAGTEPPPSERRASRSERRFTASVAAVSEEL